MLSTDTIKAIILNEGRFETKDGFNLIFRSSDQAWILEGCEFRFAYKSFNDMYEAYEEASGLEEEEIKERKRAEKLKFRIKKVSTEMLKNMAELLMNDTSQDGSGLVFVMILDELEQRLPEKEYVSFTESL